MVKQPLESVSWLTSPFLLVSSYGQMPILISSVVSLYFLEWTELFKPVMAGFSCRDRSLSLPYIDPTHEVVPLLMLLSLAFAGPAISVRSTFHGGLLRGADPA